MQYGKPGDVCGVVSVIDPVSRANVHVVGAVIDPALVSGQIDRLVATYVAQVRSDIALNGGDPTVPLTVSTCVQHLVNGVRDYRDHRAFVV